MNHLYIVRSTGVDKIFSSFRNNPMVLLILFDTFIKCLSNVNLLSNVNPRLINASRLVNVLSVWSNLT